MGAREGGFRESMCPADPARPAAALQSPGQDPRAPAGSWARGEPSGRHPGSADPPPSPPWAEDLRICSENQLQLVPHFVCLKKARSLGLNYYD